MNNTKVNWLINTPPGDKEYQYEATFSLLDNNNQVSAYTAAYLQVIDQLSVCTLQGDV